MDDQAVPIEGRTDYLQAVETLLTLARHKLQLYSIQLDPALYAGPKAIELWRQWATSSTRAQAQIIVHDAKKAVGLANPLVHLGLHLSSRFSFRDTPAQHLPMGDVLIVDERHLLKRPQPDSRTALLLRDSPFEAREAAKNFEKLWDESQPSANLRRQLL